MVKYMLCFDGSDSSEKAFRTMVTMLHPEDSVYLFTAYALPNELLASSFDSMDPLIVPGKDEFVRELNQRKKESNDLVDNLLNRLKAMKNVNIENVHTAVAETDNPKDAIVKFATEKDIEIIVMGTRGLGLVKRLLLGSVSTHVVQDAPCSVLVVR